MDELAERDATGAIATIYAEIRRVCAMPHVSLMIIFSRMIRDALPTRDSTEGD